MPFASRLAQDGVTVDAQAANAAVGRWLREVANARVHGSTGAVPAERLEAERAALRPVPKPYGGRSVRELLDQRPPQRPIVGLQHPLSGCEALAHAGAGS